VAAGEHIRGWWRATARSAAPCGRAGALATAARAALGSAALAALLGGCLWPPEPGESELRPDSSPARESSAPPRPPGFAEREPPAPRLQSATMRLGPAVPAPLGFLRFCADWPEQCGLSGAGESAEARDRRLTSRYYWNVVFHPRSAPQSAPQGAAEPDERSAPVEPLELTPQMLALINEVNAKVNHQLRWTADEVAYGRPDVWTLPLAPGGSGLGDCKDYVLEKRRALLAAGVPAQDLAIAIVRTAWGRTHSVLLVMTTSGELVLDSLSSWIRPWRDVHYAWLERQAPGREFAWVRVGSFRER
jgi:predicted transglutaminase-like cysteine proteinase